MSYTPTLWVTGDTLTAQALNKILEGISEIDGTVTTLASTTVPNLASTLSSLGDTVSELSSSVENISDATGLLSSEVTTLSSTVGALSSNVSNLASTVGSYSKDISDLSYSVDTLDNTLEAVASTVTNLSSTVSDINSSLDYFNTKIYNIENVIGRIRTPGLLNGAIKSNLGGITILYTKANRTIIPASTIGSGEEIILNNVPWEWKNGAIVCATINDEDYYLGVTQESGIYLVGAAGELSFTAISNPNDSSSNDTFHIFNNNDYDVVCTIYSVEAKCSSDYDLILMGYWNATVNNIIILQGDILEAEAKMVEGKPVKGVFIVTGDWSQDPSTMSSANTNKNRAFLPLTRFYGPYTFLGFGGVEYNSPTNNQNLNVMGITLRYDPEDGSLVSAAWSSKALS